MTASCEISPAETKTRVAAALAAAGIATEIHERRGAITPNSQAVLERRYLAKDPDGAITEDTPGMFRRVARNLSQADLLYGAGEEQRQQTEDAFYDAISTLELLPNSPTLMNAGRELQQLSACFVLPVEDDLDSIFESVKHTAIIHKSGGGTGFAFSRLRPEGSKVGSTGGVASGPVSFINAFDTATDVVKQGGTRRGANMGILDVTHPDIMKFVRAKSGGDKLQNFNISVGATREFMRCVLQGGHYDLVNPNTGQKTSALDAQAVFDEICRNAWHNGDPGLVFLDHINDHNPNPQLGVIESTNPCGEQVLLPYESCNLASINLGRMTAIGSTGATLNEEKLRRTVETAVHLLDNVIDMNSYPLPQIEDMTKLTRRIGLGVMGLADMLIQMGLRYDSEEALDMTRRVMRLIRDMAHDASHQLAIARGPFPAWEQSVYGPELAGENSRPMRNSAPTTVAPTGTISIIAGASSGVEPLFALAYERNVMDNTRLVESNPYLRAVAEHEGIYSEDFAQQVARTGTLEGTAAPQWVKDLFRTSQEIPPEWHVRMQAAVQEHVDNAVSKTINFPSEATEADVKAAYLLAYRLGCKGITVYRDGSRDNQVLSTGRTSQQNGTTRNPERHEASLLTPKERPRQMHGVTERLRTGHGNMYVTVNYDGEGVPFEVFGNLGKAGGCDSAQLEAITRLTTLALRSNIDPGEIFAQLNGITCCPAPDEGVFIKSSPDALALALYRATHDGQNPSTHQLQPTGAAAPVDAVNRPTGPACPDCNNPVMYLEGCYTCAGCGWSKCV